jgi:branched-chain amino acid transport system ATP-binding protein
MSEATGIPKPATGRARSGSAYDGIRALHGVSFSVPKGEIVTLIGANGAGKTSILRAVSGLMAYSGAHRFRRPGSQAGSGAPDRRAWGIAHVPEGRGIFGNLTVLENLQLATWQRSDKGDIAADYDRVFETFSRLKERQHQAGGTLSGGEQQMLAVGRALMSRGRLVLLG